MLYREAARDPAPERFVRVPTAVAHFRAETVMIPRPWAERHYHIVDWARLPAGGHYPAYEVPELFVGELRRTAPLLAASPPLCNA
jgi:epoxide hydrolase